MKTTREWLETLPPGYRERAIDQCPWPDIEEETMHMALVAFFPWHNTREGAEFWSDVMTHYLLGRKLPPLPNGGSPIGKLPRFPRMVARVEDRLWYLSDARGRRLAESCEIYSENWSAKRGLVRFLRRLGLDENAVRWEDQ